MFDRESAFIADHPQGGDDIFPVSVIVAVADAAEDPAAVQLVREVLGVQYAVDSGVVLVDLGVLRMEVEDRMFLAEGPDCGGGVNTLPDQMAGIKVNAQGRALFEDFQQFLCAPVIESDLCRMDLQGNLYAAFVKFVHDRGPQFLHFLIAFFYHLF